MQLDNCWQLLDIVAIWLKLQLGLWSAFRRLLERSLCHSTNGWTSFGEEYEGTPRAPRSLHRPVVACCSPRRLSSRRPPSRLTRRRLLSRGESSPTDRATSPLPATAPRRLTRTHAVSRQHGVALDRSRRCRRRFDYRGRARRRRRSNRGSSPPTARRRARGETVHPELQNFSCRI